jgi:hypothetical protein
MDEPRTLKEANDVLNRQKHRLSVWEALHDWLDKNFVGKDGRQPKALRSPGAMPEIVPEEVIEEILGSIGDGPIAQLQQEISTIESQRVVILTGEAKGKS